ncbi:MULTISPECIES: DUF7577 domain-containing protein [Halomicrobium]|uniref:DUF7577 domain-containing protein n=2 Tax=Halomicrobium mukohataei TaxID=57705 RepID=C7P1I2_HALMD|nr:MULTISPECIES: hypothetical protein [Halomicrobium]ACV47190.1 hypothetical protein Hmuk_1063 [Halomicrobium mukohataei DSM 12286]QCD65666.1 hypothetical protein E5139_08495 [Halomicrobium mukohataei]QFR20472.1 hypothetical protein GBQ70_08490 [Halomicrobium sp. ZPS1]
MDVVFWLVAYVLGFGLVQLLLYRYFQRDDPAPDATPSRVDTAAPASVDAGDPTGGGRCRECGTHNENDPAFVYCRQCGARLQ